MNGVSSGTAVTIAVRTPDIVQAELRSEKRVTGLSWRRIADLEKYSVKGIPAGTLCTIAKTGYIPPKWHKFFGVQTEVKVPVCPTCGAAPEYCGHCYTVTIVTPKRAPRPPAYRDLFAVPVAELRRAIEQRVEW